MLKQLIFRGIGLYEFQADHTAKQTFFSALSMVVFDANVLVH